MNVYKPFCYKPFNCFTVYLCMTYIFILYDIENVNKSYVLTNCSLPTVAMPPWVVKITVVNGS